MSDAQTSGDADAEGFGLLDLALPIAEHLRLLILGPLLAGLIALGATYLMAPRFTATTTFLPPQQQQAAGASALASLSALSGLAGVASIKPGDQFISLMQSASVMDRVVDAFKLMEVYKAKFRADARSALAANVHISLGRKDGLITVEVVDELPARAADIANFYVAELRRVTGNLALTEAQQRRAFFDNELKKTRDRLATAQRALESSGFSAGALRAEPKSAAEGYARLRAEVTTAEVKLQTLRQGLTEGTPEIQQQQALVAALRSQLAKLETSAPTVQDGDYIGKYREFKYQETLFELFSRQYEMARLDESREGMLIQVVDVASPPERRSAPRRGMIAIQTTIVALVLLLAFVLTRHAWRTAGRKPDTAAKISRLRIAWRGR